MEAPLIKEPAARRAAPSLAVPFGAPATDRPVPAAEDLPRTPGRAARLLRRLARSGLLAAVDLLALALIGTIAYIAWARPLYHQPAAMYLELAPLLALFLAAFAQAGLYPGLGLGPVERLRRYTYAILFVFLLLAAASFVLKLPHNYSRVTFGIALGLSLLLLPLARAAVLATVGRLRWWRERVVVVGAEAAAAALAQRLDESPQLGYRAIATLALAGPAEGGPSSALEEAAKLAASGVRVALVAAGGGGVRASELEPLRRYFERVVVAGGFGELPVEGALVRNLGGVLGIEYTSNLLLPGNRFTKRALDLVAGSVLLLLAAPLIALACALVKLMSPGPAFFVQERPGYHGRPIRVRKIRTMHADSERRLAEHLARDGALAAEWQQHQKLRNDPRLVPGIGALLRRYSIDELPQLWSVVRGQMSLAGPRPFPSYHLQCFPAEFRELRQRARPGITGLWQVVVRSAGGLDEQQALDTYYIRNWSVWLDLYILARTCDVVLSGRGAY